MINPNRIRISDDRKEQENEGKMCCKMNVIYDTYMLISTIPKDHTSAARGLYTGARLFLHSVKQSIETRRWKRPRRGIYHSSCTGRYHSPCQTRRHPEWRVQSHKV
jgi:hypothetical protein